MFAEPAQGSACALESKGSRGRIFMQPFFRHVAQHAQAAALELASYKARVKFEFLQEGALNFAGISRVHILWSSRVQELRVCLDEFHSLSRTQFSFDSSLCVTWQ